jgi:hypothetical protein
MAFRDTFAKRFTELADQFQRLPYQSSSDGVSRYSPSGGWEKWSTSAQNLIRAVFGETSPHYENFVASFKSCGGRDYELKGLHGIFQSAKEDFEGGYVFDVDLRVSGEVFGDFVAMAKHALGEGHKDVAAVLACAALEDALKRFAVVSGLDVGDKDMHSVINALKGKGLLSGPQKTLVDAMPKIRDHAMHANWDKIAAPDVGSVLGFVESFLLTKFGE